MPGSINPVRFSNEQTKFVLAIHAGAKNMLKEQFTPQLEVEHHQALNNALEIGKLLLKDGAAALDVVEKVISYLEDCPLFNAGKGAALNAAGIPELDASIMDGRTLKAGAVAGVSTIKNPILAARAVMEKSDHVFLIGPDADRFAKENGLSMVENSYFVTDRALKAFGRSHEKMGTVGAVAMDLNGDLAAGTSTGGTISSLPGRVGDSPVIGAGCYANNAICAVSCTGHGEYFLRNVVAYDLAALINYKGWPVQKSVEYIIHEKLEPQGGKGGIISIDKNGQVAIAYSTTGMFRGYVNSSGAGMTGVFEEVQRF